MVVCTGNFHAVDECGFGNETTGDVAATGDAHPDDCLFLLAQHCRRDALGAGKIYNLAILAKVIELAFPIASYGKDVDIVLLDVVDFLAKVVFYYYLVGEACRFYSLNPFEDVVAYVELASLAVETVVGDTHDEVVAQLFGAAQQVDVSLVKKVVRAVCDYFFHPVLCV